MKETFQYFQLLRKSLSMLSNWKSPLDGTGNLGQGKSAFWAAGDLGHEERVRGSCGEKATITWYILMLTLTNRAQFREGHRSSLDYNARFSRQLVADRLTEYYSNVEFQRFRPIM